MKKNTIIVATIIAILLTLLVIPVWPQPNGQKHSILERLLMLERHVQELERRVQILENNTRYLKGDKFEGNLEVKGEVRVKGPLRLYCSRTYIYGHDSIFHWFMLFGDKEEENNALGFHKDKFITTAGGWYITRNACK